MADHVLVQCSFDRHADAMLEIFNDAILNSTALYDYAPWTGDTMVAWFEAKRAGRFPVIGVEDGGGRLMGFGSYGTFRARPACKYTVEHSVYVHQDFRRRGIGRILLGELIARARQGGLHALIGGIDASNAASIAIHKEFGFREVGFLPEVAFKFGRWLDLVFYQLILDTPANPVDG